MSNEGVASSFNHTEKWLRNKDGLKIYTQAWLPDEARANLILVHGLGDHSGRYPHLVRYFVERGLAVFALDHQGHGQSEGKRGHVNSFSDFIDDLEQFRWEVMQHNERPTFLFGHSMGALISLLYLLDYQRYIKAAVISAPPIRVKMGPPTFVKEFLAKLAGVSPGLILNNGINADWISRDKNVVDAYKADSLTHPHISLSLFQGMYAGGTHVLANAGKINIPVFMLYGSDDKIISGADADAAFEKFAGSDKKKVIFENDYHEVHNDAGKFDEFAAVWEWLEPKCGAEDGN